MAPGSSLVSLNGPRIISRYNADAPVGAQALVEQQRAHGLGGGALERVGHLRVAEGVLLGEINAAVALLVQVAVRRHVRHLRGRDTIITPHA
eukprot:6315010-Pyramimonas_sp.AAC.1